MPKPKYILYLYKKGRLTKECPVESWLAGCNLGTQLAGHGLFHIDTGDYIPSRSEQMLQEDFVSRPTAVSRRKKQLLADLTASD